MQVAILLVSLAKFPECSGAVASIKKLNHEAATWFDVTTRIFEEQKQFNVNLNESTVGDDRAMQAAPRTTKKAGRKDIVCWEWNKKHHYACDCCTPKKTGSAKNLKPQHRKNNFESINGVKLASFNCSQTTRTRTIWSSSRSRTAKATSYFDVVGIHQTRLNAPILS